MGFCVRLRIRGPFLEFRLGNRRRNSRSTISWWVSCLFSLLPDCCGFEPYWTRHGIPCGVVSRNLPHHLYRSHWTLRDHCQSGCGWSTLPARKIGTIQQRIILDGGPINGITADTGSSRDAEGLCKLWHRPARWDGKVSQLRSEYLGSLHFSILKTFGGRRPILGISRRPESSRSS